MFRSMKIVADILLVLGIIIAVNGIAIIAQDRNLQSEFEHLLRTGYLPLSSLIVMGSQFLVAGLLIVGFGQIVYAVAKIAEHLTAQ